MKRDKTKAAGTSRRPSNPALDHVFGLALQQHQAGQLQQAQQLYRQALAIEPQHAPSLHYLGVLALQTAHPDTAVELIGQAIAREDRNPESHYNIALAFLALGRIDEVIAHCRRAVALKPDHADAHRSLGNALKQQGKLDEAATHYRRLVHLRPNSADAHCYVARLYAEQSKTKEAFASYQRALALDAQHAHALNGFGALLVSLDRAGEAVGYLQRAVQHAPDLPDSYINLSSALLAQGRVYDACGVINRAFEIGVAQNAIEPSLDVVRRLVATEESRDTRTLFVQCLRTLSFVPDLPYLRGLLVRALEEPWGRPSDLASAAANLLKQNHLIAAAIERCSNAWPQRLSLPEMFGEAGLTVIADDPLLETLLCATFVRDLAFERFLTNLRAALLQTANVAEEPHQESLRLCCALARQCFVNEYVFDCRPEEVTRVGALRDALAAALHSGAGVAPLQLAAVAAYFPLHSLPGTETVLQRAWPEPLQSVLTQQVAEPMQERELASAITALTAIDDDVSRAVQQQYEQNPYPRWVKAAPIGRAMTLDEYLGSKFQGSGFQPLGKDDVDVLVAGCGTGQHSVLLAQQFPSAQVLAIDLSRASLAYAARMTRMLGVSNVIYAQADILKLASLGRTFDVIDSSGVLHHLADPFAGWRVLLSLLRPGGVMRLGLYSTFGRREIEAVREFVRHEGYHATPEDIRRARQHLTTFADGTPQKVITQASDFFSLSECRDLLFHVQEKSFVLPEVEEFLSAEGLKFLGFETTAGVAQLYARKFPQDPAMADLARWHAVETENPRIFFNMYQFWVQKPA